MEFRNALGETTEVYDAECGEVSYDYDATGNLTDVTGADGAVTSMVYDRAGRKIAMSDPDKGGWEYKYNALGELKRQLDSKSQATDFDYDALGRVTNRRELKNVASLTDTTVTVVNRETTTYRSTSPGKGQVASVIYRTGESGTVLQRENFSYDSFGRQTSVSTTIGASQWMEETTYDQYSRVFQQFDASGDDNGIRFIYKNGHVHKLREARDGAAGTVYQEILDTDAWGNVTSMVLGNGVEAYATYEPNSGRLDVLRAYDNQGVELQDVDYLFDVLGNLKHRHDTSGSLNHKETFDYDDLNRLETVKLSVNAQTAATTLSLNYNAAGNITSKSDVGAYSYGANGAGPHAVTSAGGVSYSYDANGNQVSGDGRTITYTVFDKPDSIIKGSHRTEFSYGIGNARYRRIDKVSGSVDKTTTYLGDVEYIVETGGSTFYRRTLGGVALQRYYPSTGVRQHQYLLKDHLGSIHTMTNEASQIVTRMHFGAFGQRQDVDWVTPLTAFQYAPLNDITTRGFTGHEHVDDTGVIHMNGRIYDPLMGRFLQADPVVQAPKNAQNLNRYSYVVNNPLSYTDPSGYSFGSFIGRLVGKYWKTFMVAVISYATYGAASGWAAGTAWGGGAAAGTVNAAGGAFAGAVAGAVGGALMTGTLEGAFWGAVSGAALGAVGGAQRLSNTEKVLAAGSTNGVISELQGGKFGHGFVSAGTGFWSGMKFGGEISAGNFLASVAVAGTVSELTGGKFANGAVSAAMAYAMASAASRSRQPKGEWIYPEGGSTDLNKYDTVMTNGILGNRDEFVEALNASPVPAAGYFNSSSGALGDFFESFVQKFFGWAGDSLAAGFSERLAGVNHPMTIIAHSQGTLTVANAARYYGLPEGSTLIMRSPAISRWRANSAANAIGGSMQYVQPYGDIANIYAPSLNPVRWMSGFGDVFCGACTHTANGLP